MSRQMKSFADYFMQGYALGGQWWGQAEQRAVARENAKLKAKSDAVREAREERKLGIYAEGVRANAEAARARAYRTMNPVAKGGGGGGGGATDADADALRKEGAGRGIIGAYQPVPAGGNVTNNTTVEASEAPLPEVPQPPAADVVQTESRGGRVKRMAEGGIVSGMSLGEAQAYMDYGGSGGGRGEDNSVQKATSAGYDAAAKATEAREAKRAETAKQAVNTAPPNLTGTGETYAEGGKVRRYASNEDKLINPRATPGMAEVPVGRGRAQIGANFDPGSKYGTVEGGYEHPVGDRTTLGIHGNVGKDIGPGGAEAKPDWGVGIRGRVKFQSGGRVRNYQSGGRVMREDTAIDTGTSGPGSGYGYQAAPPARRY